MITKAVPHQTLEFPLITERMMFSLLTSSLGAEAAKDWQFAPPETVNRHLAFSRDLFLAPAGVVLRQGARRYVGALVIE